MGRKTVDKLPRRQVQGFLGDADKVKVAKKQKSSKVVGNDMPQHSESKIEKVKKKSNKRKSYTVEVTSKKETKKKLKKVVYEELLPEDTTVVNSSKKLKKSAKSKGKKKEAEVVVLPRLSATSGFVWNATPDLLPVVANVNAEQESSDDEPEETKTKAKRSRQAIIAEKRAEAQKEEARLRAIERRLMDTDQPPECADEFDRLVLSSPDSSVVWVQYMVHHLQATEIEKARAVARRALKTISFREEQEKLNVWVALLNLENLYGTEESLATTLEEAAKFNDSYLVYTKMLQIYSDSHKIVNGDKLIALMTKKYRDRQDTWYGAATFYMKHNQLEKARNLLQRALKCLDKKEHVTVISRFAQLENKMGSMERAQTLMEQILTSYPKRVDIWSSYVDMLVKSGLILLARQVLERAVVQKLQSQKMKTLFKKFLTFEETHGTEADAARVRRLALDYVQSAAGTDRE